MQFPLLKLFSSALSTFGKNIKFYNCFPYTVTAQKNNFSVSDFISKSEKNKNSSFFTLSEEIFNEKRHFLYSVYHYMKSVQIRCFLWSAFSHIQCKYGKIQTRKSVFGPFFDSPFITITVENTVQKKFTLQSVWHYVIEKIMLRSLLFWYSWDIWQMQLEGLHLLIGLNWSSGKNKKD